MKSELSCRLHQVRMNYGAGDVLKGLDLELFSGKIIALLGLNGAGKSTLMQIIAGHLKPTAGEIAIEGSVAMVHQELSLIPDLSIAENLFLERLGAFRRFGVLQSRHLERAAETALSRVGLTLDTKRAARSLTTGEAQLVEIARCLAQDARVLILDEPTSALSRKECDRLFSILRDIACSGSTILFVSHRLDEVAELAHEVVVLRDGVVAGALRGDQIDSDRIVELMTGTKTSINAAAVASKTEKIPSPPAEREAPLLCLSKLKIFSDRLLASLDEPLELHPGQCVGLAGLMGSGRSVFLRALASQLTLASSGRSFDLEDLRVEAKVSGLPCAYVHEDRKTAGLFPDLSAVENIGIAQHRKSWSKARALFPKLKVKGDAGQTASSLSGGNQQKLLFGRALLSEARILILDEPTRGVDAHSREEIYRLMQAFLANGGAILWASSDFDELVEQSDRILTVSSGVVRSYSGRVESGDKLTAVVLQMESHPGRQIEPPLTFSQEGFHAQH